MITFTVLGNPAPQGSKRLLPFGGKRGGRPMLVESSKAVGPWRAKVRAAAERARDLLPADEQARSIQRVYVWLAFRMPRPAGHFLPANSRRASAALREEAPDSPIGKPDLDKLVRAVLDALTGVLWIDDAQVVALTAEKLYADEGFPAGVEVQVRERWASAEDHLRTLLAPSAARFDHPPQED